MRATHSVSDKIDALRSVQNLGAKVAMTRRVSSPNYEAVIDAMRSLGVKHWVVRSPQPHKAFFLQPAYEERELKVALSQFFATFPNAKLLLTELIPARWSGAVFRSAGFAYLEYVPGALQSMLRDGATPSRVELSTEGSIAIAQYNDPEFSYTWTRTELVRNTNAKSIPFESDVSLSEQCTRLAALCPEYQLLEWVESFEGEVVVLDAKEISSDFLGTRDDLLNGISSGRISSLPSRTLAVQSEKAAEIQIERPLYSFLSDSRILHAKRIICYSGAVLSHLVVTCAERGVECIVDGASRKF
jgi:hypothetical protein